MTNEIIKPSELDKQVYTLKELDRQIATLKEQQDIIKDRLKDIMDSANVSMLVGINEKVTWEETISHLFNEKQFIKDFGEDKLNYYKSKIRHNRPFNYK